MINKELKLVFAALVALLASATTLNLNAAQMVALEDAQEANASDVMLPATYVGTIFFKHCEKCNQPPLQLSDETKFLIDAQQVPFETFKNAVEKKHRIYTIFYKPTTREVTRLKMN